MRLLLPAFLAVITLLPACVPTTQIQYHRTRGDIRVNPDTPLSVNVHTPSLRGKAQGELDMKASFATQPRGQRFTLIAEKIPYVESYPDRSYFLTRSLELVSANGTRYRAWPKGEWELHLERSSPQGREIYETSFQLYTLIWTPFLGPPN